ncbi:MAG: helix-hairpin-helix domain-containing protein, partial [Acidobacteria bacterium]|nr:helix-hairpin-helix domain-containing protein [Acidobacteriota bacterium]
MGEKSAKNLLEEIEKSKNKNYEKILYALGIRMVGVETAKIIAEHFNTIDLLMSASEEDLMKIEGIGPKVSKEIVEFFKIKENVELIEKLKSAGL